jgi:hypothetical protein
MTDSGVSWGVSTKVRRRAQRAKDLEGLHEPESIIGEGHAGTNISLFGYFWRKGVEDMPNNLFPKKLGRSLPISLPRDVP